MICKLKTVATLALLLSACASLNSKHQESENIQTIKNGALGSVMFSAPDISSFDSMKVSPRKIYVECHFESRPLDETEKNTSPAIDPQRQKECERSAQTLLSSKGMNIMPGLGSGTERWLFRVDEKFRKSYESATDLFRPNEREEVWATLTRFRPGALEPYSHFLVNGDASFLKEHWDVGPRIPTKEDSLAVILTKALLLKSFEENN